jgi:Tol biopolymer transport system component
MNRSISVSLLCVFILAVRAFAGDSLEGTVIFAANRDGSWKLFLWRGGKEPIQLTYSPLDARTPSIAPDSSRVAYTTSDGGLWLLDLKSRANRKLADRFSNGQYGYPVWVSGDLLAYTIYVVTPPTEDSDIFVSSLHDDKQRVLVRQTGSQDYLSVSSEGTRVAYMSSVTTSVFGLGTTITQQLWTASLRTGKVEQLTVGGSRDTRSSWSPDEKRIAFSSDREGKPEIFVLELGTRKLTRVTTGPGDKTDPCWSPNGRQILFVSTAAGKRSLSTFDLETHQTTSLRPFGDKNIEIRDPSWAK